MKQTPKSFLRKYQSRLLFEYKPETNPIIRERFQLLFRLTSYLLYVSDNPKSIGETEKRALYFSFNKRTELLYTSLDLSIIRVDLLHNEEVSSDLIKSALNIIDTYEEAKELNVYYDEIAIHQSLCNVLREIYGR